MLAQFFSLRNYRSFTLKAGTGPDSSPAGRCLESASYQAAIAFERPVAAVYLASPNRPVSNLSGCPLAVQIRELRVVKELCECVPCLVEVSLSLDVMMQWKARPGAGRLPQKAETSNVALSSSQAGCNFGSCSNPFCSAKWGMDFLQDGGVGPAAVRWLVYDALGCAEGQPGQPSEMGFPLSFAALTSLPVPKWNSYGWVDECYCRCLSAAICSWSNLAKKWLHAPAPPKNVTDHKPPIH